MGIIGTLWVGVGMLGAMMSTQTYLVDAFTKHAASAIAANTVLRSLMGAFLPLAGPSLYKALGYGWFVLSNLIVSSYQLTHLGEIRYWPS